MSGFPCYPSADGEGAMKKGRSSVSLLICCVCSTIAVGQMMRVENHIGNDPQKVQLCISRTKGKLPKSHVVPFEIDQERLDLFLREHPDETIIALADGNLVECFVGGDGKYGPQMYVGETTWWHRVKPEQFQPTTGPIFERQSTHACLDAAQPILTHRPNFYKSSIVGTPSEVGYSGVSVGDVKGTQYDYVLLGMALYKTNGPDMENVKFRCLLSPMLTFKAFEFGWYGKGR